jgi:hypothetical protein
MEGGPDVRRAGDTEGRKDRRTISGGIAGSAAGSVSCAVTGCCRDTRKGLGESLKGGSGGGRGATGRESAGAL